MLFSDLTLKDYSIEIYPVTQQMSFSRPTLLCFLKKQNKAARSNEQETKALFIIQKQETKALLLYKSKKQEQKEKHYYFTFSTPLAN